MLLPTGGDGLWRNHTHTHKPKQVQQKNKLNIKLVAERSALPQQQRHIMS